MPPPLPPAGSQALSQFSPVPQSEVAGSPYLFRSNLRPKLCLNRTQHHSSRPLLVQISTAQPNFHSLHETDEDGEEDEPTDLESHHAQALHGESGGDFRGPEGFAGTTAFLAGDPDMTTVIARRFHAASIWNLLWLEGRVAALEDHQRTLDELNVSDIVGESLVERVATEVEAADRSWEEFACVGRNLGYRR